MALPVQDMAHGVVSLLLVHDEQDVCGDEVQALAVAHAREGDCQQVQHVLEFGLDLGFSYVGGDGAVDVPVYLLQLGLDLEAVVGNLGAEDQFVPDLGAYRGWHSSPHLHFPLLSLLLGMGLPG